jgi:hypothetical protein
VGAGGGRALAGADVDEMPTKALLDSEAVTQAEYG